MGRGHWNVKSSKRNFTVHQKQSGWKINKPNYWEAAVANSFSASNHERFQQKQAFPDKQGEPTSGNQHTKWGPSERSEESPQNRRHERKDTPGRTSNKPGNSRHKKWDASKEAGKETSNNSHKRWNVNNHDNQSHDSLSSRKQSPEKIDSNQGTHTLDKDERQNPNASSSNSHKRWDVNDHDDQSHASYDSIKQPPEEIDTNQGRHTLDKDERQNPNAAFNKGSFGTAQRSNPHPQGNLNFNALPPWQQHWQLQSSQFGYPGNFNSGDPSRQMGRGFFNQGPANFENFRYNYSDNQTEFWQDNQWSSFGPYQVWFDTKQEPYSQYSQFAHGSDERKKEANIVTTDERKRKEDEEAVPLLGSEEERLKNRKATTEWLKERMKNKDVSQFNTMLKEKSKQKVTEVLPKPSRKDAINPLDSALDASSIEAVKQNLADVLPGDTSLLKSLLQAPVLEGAKAETEHPKACTATMLEKTDDSAKEKVTALTQSACADVCNISNSTTISLSSSSETPVKSNAVPNTVSPAFSSNLQKHQSNSSPSLLTVTKNDKDKFSRLIRLLTKGQIKDLLANPRPGKFEYLLKQQVKKHRLESSREIRLSKESSASGENVSEYLSNERDVQEDCLNLLPIYDAFPGGDLDTDLVINMTDLPPEFLQELHDALGSGFTDDPDSSPVESGMEQLNPAEAGKPETGLLSDAQQSCTETTKASTIPQSDVLADKPPSKLPEIRLRSFAKCSTMVSTEQESVAQLSVVVSHKERSVANEKISVLSYSGTLDTEEKRVLHSAVEADTTVEPSCPLEGSSLLASLASAAANSSFPSLSAASPFFSENVPETKIETPLIQESVTPQIPPPALPKPQKKKLSKILKQDVFFSAEDYGKKNTKGKANNKYPHMKNLPGKAKFVDHSEPGCSRPSSIANFIASRLGTTSQPSIPDSTCSEPASERVSPQLTPSTSNNKSPDTIPLCQKDGAEDDEPKEEDRPKSPSCPQHAPELEHEIDEATILSRVQKIIKELAKIKTRETQLIEERSYLYHKLHKVYGNNSLAGEPKKQESKRRSSETGSINKRQKKLSQSSSSSEEDRSDGESVTSANDKRNKKSSGKKMEKEKKAVSPPSNQANAASQAQSDPSQTLNKRKRTVFDNSSASELATSDNESVVSANEKRKGKSSAKKTEKKKKVAPQLVTQVSVSVSSRNEPTSSWKNIPEVLEPTAYKKPSLGYYLSDVSLKSDSFSEHDGIITQVKVIRKTVLASSSNGKVYAFSSSTGILRKTYGDSKFPVKCFQLDEKKTKSKLEARLYYGTGDGHFHCYALHGGDRVHPPILVSNDIMCMDSKWNFVYMGTKGGSVMRYNIETESVESEPISNDYTAVLAIALSNEGPRKVLVVACENQPIVLRDASTGLLLRTVTHSWTGRSYKFTLGVNLVFCSTNKEIFSFWYSNGEVVNTYNVPSQVTCLCLSRKVLYVGCADGSVRKFDTETHRLVGVLKGSADVNVVCMDIVNDKVLVAKRGGLLEVLDNK